MTSVPVRLLRIYELRKTGAERRAVIAARQLADVEAEIGEAQARLQDAQTYAQRTPAGLERSRIRSLFLSHARATRQAHEAYRDGVAADLARQQAKARRYAKKIEAWAMLPAPGACEESPDD